MPVCRFLWVLQHLAGAGFYVISAYQPANNSADITAVSAPAIFLRVKAFLHFFIVSPGLASLVSVFTSSCCADCFFFK